MSLNKKRRAGFTLIEVLLALGIFSSLAISANQVLRNVINSNIQTQEVSDKLKALQQTLFIMDSDFRQLVARSYRNNGQQVPEQIFEMGQGVLGSEDQGIRFARGGWINPNQLFDRGEVVKVGYRMQDDALVRMRWAYPDDSAAYEPAVQQLYKGIKSLKFAVSDDGKNWLEIWESKTQMPKAIRISFDTENFGELTRIYLLPVAPKVGVQNENNE